MDDGLKIAPDVTLPIDFVTQTAAILAQRRKGKRLALDTPLPTPTGWTTMGDVQIGDSLFDELGEPCRVTFVSEIAEGDSYRVRFSDGSEIVADAEHLWVTESRPVRRRESAVKMGVLTAAGRAGRPQSQQTAATIGARLATLRKLGLVEQGQPIRLTPEGFKAAGGARVLPTGQALLDHWLSHPKVGEGERKVLLALIDAYPSTLSNDELADLTGYSATASTIGARLANLRKLGLVEKGARRVTSEFYEAIRG